MPEPTPSIDYIAEMHAILEQPLTPRVIERYAQDVLHNLVGLVTSVTVDYESQPTLPRETTAATEDAALSYFGLPDVEGTLQHIQEAANKINALNTVVDSARQTQTVITPSDITPSDSESLPASVRGAGESQYEAPEVVPKLKTILFILDNEFDNVNVHQPGAIILELGSVKEDMARKHGYYFLNVPSLQRTVLVCDEMDNATYVFDDSERDKIELDDELLKSLNKTELDGFIDAYPGLGARIEYSDTYVDNVTSALGDLEHYGGAVRGRPGKSFLVPNAPEGNMSVDAFAREVGVGAGALREQVIKSITDKLGKVALYRHGAWITDSLSPSQQNILLEELDNLKLLVDQPSEDYPEVSRDTMRDVFRVKRERIDNAVAALDEQLGPRRRYLFHRTRDEGFDPWQQNMVFDWLWEQGYVRPQPPETTLSVAGISEWLGLGDKVIYRALAEIGNAIGITDEYKFNSQISPGYDPWQQNMVYDHLNVQHMFAPNAPEGIWTARRISREWGVPTRQVYGAINEIEPALGGKDYYKFGGRPAVGYDESKRAILRQALERKGVHPKDSA